MQTIILFFRKFNFFTYKGVPYPYNIIYENIYLLYARYPFTFIHFAKINKMEK